MSSWAEVESELALWSGSGRRAVFWWRDDDAVEPCAALDRLLALAASRQAPLALAVIPAGATDRLAEAIAPLVRLVQPMQHGYAHEHHAPAGAKKCELTDQRPPAELDALLAQGQEIMARLFGANALPVMVPPWNRIGPKVAGRLTALGYRGLSTFGADDAGGPPQVNTHLDIMRWQQPRGFLGEAEALSLLLAELQHRRTEDPAAPLGLLSHHLAHDPPAWRFLERLIGLISEHAGAALHRPDQVFALGPP